MKLRLSVLVVVLALCLVPAFGQAPALNSVKFNNFSFGYDTAMASGVNIYTFPGDPVDFDQPGGPQPPSTSYMLYQQLPVPEYAQAAVAEIRIYEIERLVGYSFAEERYRNLLALVTDRPDLTSYMQVPGDMDIMVELPFLPVFPAAQVMRARAQYIDTDTVQGISFITVFRQDVYPFTAHEFLYAFQGITKDGSRYISVLAPVSTTLFPTELADDFDFDAFFATYPDYVTQSVATLNAATPEDFTPSPLSFELLIQTFAFDS